MTRRNTPQPIKGIIAMRRITGRSLAVRTQRSESYVSRVLNGYETPSPDYRQELSALLDVPVSDLFDDASFA